MCYPIRLLRLLPRLMPRRCVLRALNGSKRFYAFNKTIMNAFLGFWSLSWLYTHTVLYLVKIKRVFSLPRYHLKPWHRHKTTINYSIRIMQRSYLICKWTGQTIIHSAMFSIKLREEYNDPPCVLHRLESTIKVNRVRKKIENPEGVQLQYQSVA